MAHSFLHDLANAIVANLGLFCIAVLVVGAFCANLVTRAQTSVSPTRDWRARPLRPPPDTSAEASWPAEPLDPARARASQPIAPESAAPAATSLPPLTLPKPAAPASSSRERALIAIIGASILILGVLIPASPWVTTGVLPMAGKRAYVVLAFFASLQAWRGGLRSMAVTGGIAAGLLLVTGLVSAAVTILRARGSVSYDPSFFALGWSWLFMLVGSILILVGAWFDTGASQDET